MIRIPWTYLLIFLVIFFPVSLGQNSELVEGKDVTVTIRAHYDTIGVGSTEDGSKIVVPDLPEDVEDGQEFPVRITSKSEEYIIGKAGLTDFDPLEEAAAENVTETAKTPGFEYTVSLICLLGIVFILNYLKKK
jgi:hypothetical protein